VDASIRRQQGMTLVEVMVAAVILALVMIGVMAVATHTQRTTLRLQQKTQAGWVANSIAAEIRAGVHGKITPTGSFQGRHPLGNNNWFWRAQAQSDNQGDVIQLKISVQEDENTPEIISIQTAVWSPQ
jgi:general secretion pathway protein I